MDVRLTQMKAFVLRNLPVTSRATEQSEALLEEITLASLRFGHLPTVWEWHVVRYDWCCCYICLGGEGVDWEGGRGGMGADVMGSEGAAHASI